jgi:hypothetical protein
LSLFVLGCVGKDKNSDDILLLDDPLRFPNHPIIRVPTQANCFIDMKHNSSGAPPRLLIWWFYLLFIYMFSLFVFCF